MSDVKVLTPGNPVYYPEVMVTCEPESSNPYVVSNPCPIVEVVSPETEAFDRREKWMACHTIPSLKAYLMVDQDSRSVDRAFRLSGGEWLFAAEVDDSELRLPCPPGADLSLARICHGL
jgi:Uma2 family endonuclease